MTGPVTKSWVFLGDSLTEGVGSSRVTFVTELVKLFRSENAARTVQYVRLRRVDPDTFNPFIKTNFAGLIDEDLGVAESSLWMFNLAAEGQTIEHDIRWLPLLRHLRPDHIFIYRGSLESIIRPAAARDGEWPWWVPRRWRGFVAMDPQCYFSTTWYRRAKQTCLDALKQRARHRMLADRPGRPWLDSDAVISHYAQLLARLGDLQAHVHMLGLIPPDEERFPGTGAHFAAVNERLRDLAASAGVDFIDWAQDVNARREQAPWRYRDGFHPNLSGAQLLARVLRERLTEGPW